MHASTQTRLRLAAAVVLLLAPVSFGLRRALSAASDRRMLWMALAAYAGAAVVYWLAPQGIRSSRARPVLILVVAAVLAAITAYWLGATAAFGVWAVAIVLAGCLAIASVLARNP